MIHTDTKARQFLGADVSKAKISLFDLVTGELMEPGNTKPALTKAMKRFSGHALVVEATGGHEALLIRLALAAGMTVYRVDPARVRAHMHASGQKAKTDPLDAWGLADFAAHHIADLHPYIPPDPAERRLVLLVRRRADLVQMRTAETNRLQAPDNQPLQKGIKKMLAFIEAQLAEIENDINILIAETVTLAAKINVLAAEKGIGQTTAAALLANLPELGQLSGKQIAGLAGLAPIARDSGTKSGYRRTGYGRTTIRPIIFMACMSAVRYNPDIKKFYNRLIQNGKKPLVALVAAMRKLITILNAKIRDEIFSKKIAEQS